MAMMKGPAFHKMAKLALLCVFFAVVSTQENDEPAEVLTPSDFNIAKGRSVSNGLMFVKHSQRLKTQ